MNDILNGIPDPFDRLMMLETIAVSHKRSLANLYENYAKTNVEFANLYELMEVYVNNQNQMAEVCSNLKKMNDALVKKISELEGITEEQPSEEI
tara:strand:+ start:1130 stop:1411 length:282 start_codon:yes stop_codon:yes gene_type:complete